MNAGAKKKKANGLKSLDFAKFSQKNIIKTFRPTVTGIRYLYTFLYPNSVMQCNRSVNAFN